MLYEYVVIHEYQYDSGDNGLECWIFQELEFAKQKMNEEAKIAKQCMLDNVSDIEEDIGEMYYSVYEQGEYCYNHENIIIKRTEVQ